MIREATEDRLHQDYRSPMFPEAPQLLARLVAAGALASCWSGAGPTLLGICDGEHGERVRAGAEEAMEEIGVPGRALLLRRRPRGSHRRGNRAVTRTFHIRTYGCQMNEHDSERLAGLLIADGLEPTDDIEHADLVVFNTCCIRENADNKFYGHLGQFKALRESRPGMQIAVGGCLAQKDRDAIRARAGHVDVVFGTHNLARAPALLRQAAAHGPRRRDPGRTRHRRAPRISPLALSAARELPYAAWVTIQMGCDNSCAFCIVPQVRGPEVSRPVDDIVAEVKSLSARGVTEVTLLGQNVNSYGRDITRRRPLFARPPARRGGGRRGAAGPLHEPAPEGPPSRDHRGHGRDAGGVRAPPPAPAIGERPGADRHAPRLPRRSRYLARLAAAAGRHPRPGRDHRHHRGLPGRDR